MVQLLHKKTIRATDSSEILLQLVKSPITQHLPKNVPVVELSVNAPLVRLKEYVSTRFKDTDKVIFVIGGFAHGHLKIDYGTDKVAISEYPLSAAAVGARVCEAFEEFWGVL